MKCRHCRATAQSSNFLGRKVEGKYLYKCERKECGRFFWHRQVLKLFNPDCPKSKKNQEIEKGIEIANLGFNPMNNGDNIIINVPALTEERRTELAKQAKAETEEAKIAIRNARKDANNEVKKSEDFSEDLKKNSELDIQEITDSFIAKVDKIFDLKQNEIMTL